MTREQRIEQAKKTYPGLTVYYGSGYPIAHPHILVFDSRDGIYTAVKVYPEGEGVRRGGQGFIDKPVIHF